MSHMYYFFIKTAKKFDIFRCQNWVNLWVKENKIKLWVFEWEKCKKRGHTRCVWSFWCNLLSISPGKRSSLGSQNLFLICFCRSKVLTNPWASGSSTTTITFGCGLRVWPQTPCLMDWTPLWKNTSLMRCTRTLLIR